MEVYVWEYSNDLRNGDKCYSLIDVGVDNWISDLGSNSGQSYLCPTNYFVYLKSAYVYATQKHSEEVRIHNTRLNAEYVYCN